MRSAKNGNRGKTLWGEAIGSWLPSSWALIYYIYKYIIQYHTHMTSGVFRYSWQVEFQTTKPNHIWWLFNERTTVLNQCPIPVLDCSPSSLWKRLAQGSNKSLGYQFFRLEVWITLVIFQSAISNILSHTPFISAFDSMDGDFGLNSEHQIAGCIIPIPLFMSPVPGDHSNFTSPKFPTLSHSFPCFIPLFTRFDHVQNIPSAGVLPSTACKETA